MKLTLKGLAPETRILVGLYKTISHKTWTYNTVRQNGLHQEEEVVERELDVNYIFYNDLLPEDDVIELPDFLYGKEMLVRARKFGYRFIDESVTIFDDTTLVLYQPIERALNLERKTESKIKNYVRKIFKQRRT